MAHRWGGGGLRRQQQRKEEEVICISVTRQNEPYMLGRRQRGPVSEGKRGGVLRTATAQAR
jgi:hypothetical protein